MAEVNIDFIAATGQNGDAAIEQFRPQLPGALSARTVGDMIALIVGRVSSENKVRRLRIFGHAAPGVLGIAPLTRNRFGEVDFRDSSSLSVIMWTAGGLLNERDLKRLDGLFADGGWAELHGCRVAEGSAGEGLLKALARLWHVNVAGGTGAQIVGGGLEQGRVADPDGHVGPKIPRGTARPTR